MNLPPFAELTVFGAPWCGDCKASKKFLGEQRVSYHWVDVDEDEAGLSYITKLQDGRSKIPTIVFPNGEFLVEPTNAELAAKLGLQTWASRKYYDLIVVGGGPAGLTAALYAGREGLDVLVIEKAGLGGQAGITERIDNFPGFPDGVSGVEFADRLVRQAQRFGVELLQAQNVTGIAINGSHRCVVVGDGNEYGSRAILLAPGSKYRRLGVPGEEELIGAGVHFCATCDGPFYRGKSVAVIGGGNSAGEESLFLTRFADKVTLIVRDTEMSASKIVVDKVTENPKIETLYETEVTSLHGSTKLESITVRDRRSGTTRDLTPSGLFVFIGLAPSTDWLPDTLERDPHGFIRTSSTLETSVPGVFAAGDARLGSTKQAASAAGEGATVALMIREYLKHV